MCIKNNVLPQANIYSSKLLFDKLEDRNQKRIAQMIKRKNALLSKNKNKYLNKNTKEKSSEQMITPSTQEISTTIFTNNISKSNFKEENSYIKIINPKKPKTMERYLSSSIHKNKNNDRIKISNNCNIQDYDDFSEKEVNISNLNDNDNIVDNSYEKEKLKNINNKLIILNDNDKNINKKNSVNINGKYFNSIHNNLINNNINQRNKYAIEFLSSSSDSFVEFKNKLVARAKYNKNYFTLSYSQALFLDYNNLNNKDIDKEKKYNYEVNEIIKEENESYSPNINTDKNNIIKNKLYIRHITNITNTKKKILKNYVKINNNKIQNKSFCKTLEFNMNNSKNLIKRYEFNKKDLINNCKYKIPKTKLSLEITNKRKNYYSKDYKNYWHNNDKEKNNNNINMNMKNTLSPKFLKIKCFMNDINRKENDKNDKNNKEKEKSKKIKKKVKKN